jgi:hypothetical protein
MAFSIKMRTPMGLTSTQFISYHEIKVDDTDLIEDAWGINNEFNDVISLLRMFRIEPGELIVKKLIDRIRSNDQ